MGYPEINPYSLVKACATENEAMLAKDFDRDGNAIRWKSKRVMYAHYKSDARVWPPMHLREDKDELKSELSESEHYVCSQPPPFLSNTLGSRKSRLRNPL